MQRICGSLAAAGYQTLLVGYRKKKSIPLFSKNYAQKRINCWFKKGKLFYAEYNLRLFVYLLFKKADCICAIDLDTMLPCYWVSKLKGIKRVYDAHEYFSQLEEVISRPGIYRFWYRLERKMIPRFKHGYTVCRSIAGEFKKNYEVDYEVIRNVPVLENVRLPERKQRILIYQGAVNKGRGLDKLVAAMLDIDAMLWVCGDGNFMDEMKRAATGFNVSEKIILWGMLSPTELKTKTAEAYIAINPFEKNGLNQYLSLSNKFFDYIHSLVPQITMNYPEYKNINDEYEVALLIDDLEPKTISKAVNRLLSDASLYKKIMDNCIQAGKALNWQQEEKKLLAFYQNLFHE